MKYYISNKSQHQTQVESILSKEAIVHIDRMASTKEYVVTGVSAGGHIIPFKTLATSEADANETFLKLLGHKYALQSTHRA